MKRVILCSARRTCCTVSGAIEKRLVGAGVLEGGLELTYPEVSTEALVAAAAATDCARGRYLLGVSRSRFPIREASSFSTGISVG
jgi:hypothetical protein